MTAQARPRRRQLPASEPSSSDSPAPTWEQGLIVGSGRVGGLLFGAPGALVLSLSHERFFLPANPTPQAPDMSGALADIRQAILQGDGDLAADLMMDAARPQGFDQLIWTNPLAICATLAIRSSADGSEPVHRTIDLEHGEVGIEWDDPVGGRVTLRALAPRDTETVAIALAAERSVTFELELGVTRDAAESAPTGAPDYSALVRAEVEAGPVGILRATSTDSSGVAAVTTVAGAGEWRPAESGAGLSTSVEVPGGGSVVLSVSVGVATSTAWVPEPAPSSDWEALRARQAETHGELVGRSVLQLSGESAPTTDELWRRARSGDPGARRGVVEVAYLSGRANAISATGELPPTLQGVWQGTWSPAWSADYTMNGNVQNGGIASLIPTGDAGAREFAAAAGAAVPRRLPRQRPQHLRRRRHAAAGSHVGLRTREPLRARVSAHLLGRLRRMGAPIRRRHRLGHGRPIGGRRSTLGTGDRRARVR